MPRNNGDSDHDQLVQNTQSQVDEVVDVMRDNVNKVLERDANLTNLEDRSEQLQDGASRFKTTSGQVKKKMWWKNLKWTLALIGIGLLIVLIIILVTKPWTW